MTSSADIYGRAHERAANILRDIILTSGIVVDSGKDLMLQIELLAETKEFTKTAKADVLEAISRLRGLSPALEPILQQIPEDLEIVLRGLAESVDLAKQARGKLNTTEEYLQDLTEKATGQVNTAANIETLMRGREYLMTNRDTLKRAIRLAGVKVVRDILAEVEQETRPME